MSMAKLSAIRTTTMRPSDNAPDSVGFTTMVRMMSATTRISMPSRMARPSRARTRSNAIDGAVASHQVDDAIEQRDEPADDQDEDAEDLERLDGVVHDPFERHDRTLPSRTPRWNEAGGFGGSRGTLAP